MTCETSPGFRSNTAACAGGRPVRRTFGRVTVGRLDLHARSLESFFLQLSEVFARPPLALAGRRPAWSSPSRLLPVLAFLRPPWPSAARRSAFRLFLRLSLFCLDLLRARNEQAIHVGLLVRSPDDLCNIFRSRPAGTLAACSWIFCCSSFVRICIRSRTSLFLCIAESSPGLASWPHSTWQSAVAERPASCFFSCGVMFGSQMVRQFLELGLGDDRLAICCGGLRGVRAWLPHLQRSLPECRRRHRW